MRGTDAWHRRFPATSPYAAKPQAGEVSRKARKREGRERDPKSRKRHEWRGYVSQATPAHRRLQIRLLDLRLFEGVPPFKSLPKACRLGTCRQAVPSLTTLAQGMPPLEPAQGRGTPLIPRKWLSLALWFAFELLAKSKAAVR